MMFNFEWLLKNIELVKGVGEKTLEAFHRLGIYKVKDILLYKPVECTKKELLTAKNYRLINNDNIYIAKVRIINIQVVQKFFKPKVFTINGIFNDIVSFDLKFFNFVPYHIIKQIEEGQEYYFVGQIKRFNGILQMVHPDFYKLEQLGAINITEPKYPLTYGINSKTIQTIVQRIITGIGNDEFEEWLPSRVKRPMKLPNFISAIKTMHYLYNYTPAEYKQALERLAFDEIYAHQIMLRLTKYKRTEQLKESYDLETNKVNELINILPFELTDGQKHALSEIKNDLRAKKPMMRLLQGDVGSGKTIVALITALMATTSGQSVIMVPTDILASQHYEYAKNLLDQIGVNVVLLKSKMKTKDKQSSIDAIKDGAAQIVIGTHSIIQEDIIFQNLRVAIIDEQHRFGVEQRLKLANKGNIVDVLLMTATPIPRTLALARYGDINTSIIDVKPAGRKPIETRSISINRIDEIIAFMQKIMDKDQKIYWVCPLIEENEDEEKKDISLTSVITRFNYLKAIFGNQVALIHGQMNNDEKNKVMDEFKNGSECKILVATTVIEVGVNVPEATLIVIENAEKFGLSQLHQLRGRVGRSTLDSYCILACSYKVSDSAKDRIEAMKKSNDGFYLSEKDLEIRGGGEILGTKQSGEINFILADFPRDLSLLDIASKEASLLFSEINEHQFFSSDLVKSNPHLKSIIDLLAMFNYEDCLRYHTA